MQKYRHHSIIQRQTCRFCFNAKTKRKLEEIFHWEIETIVRFNLKIISFHSASYSETGCLRISFLLCVVFVCFFCFWNWMRCFSLLLALLFIRFECVKNRFIFLFEIDRTQWLWSLIISFLKKKEKKRCLCDRCDFIQESKKKFDTILLNRN